MTISSLEAAKKICELSDWTITNLKLHKLLYLSQMVCLGRYAVPLVDKEFEAWMYGPVLPNLYEKFKIFGSSPLTHHIFFNISSNNDQPNNTEILKETWNKLGGKGEWELVAMTHRKEGAWAKHYIPYLNLRIPNQSIIDEYKVINHER